MNLIIAGSQTIQSNPQNEVLIRRIIVRDFPSITKLICGCAQGGDRVGFQALQWNEKVKVDFFPAWFQHAEWAQTAILWTQAQHPESSLERFNLHLCPEGPWSLRGFERNVRMAKEAGPQGGLLTLWDGQSKGTLHMINEAHNCGLKVHVEVIK